MASPLDILPADVREALQHGNTLEAIKRLRHARGVSLKSAKRQIDGVVAEKSRWTAQAPQTPPHQHVQLHQGQSNRADDADEARVRSHLAPGEMPRSRDAAWGWGAFALVVATVYWLLRGES